MKEKGFTLIEVLAVILILSIIAGIAVLSISRLVETAKQDAFVTQALHLKEAGDLFLIRDRIYLTGVPTEISYKELYETGFIEAMEDPFTQKKLDPAHNSSYVKVSGTQVVSVCLKGEEKTLCPSSLSELTTEAIK